MKQSRDFYYWDGVEVPFHVWKANMDAEKEAAREEKTERLFAEWEAEMGPRNIFFDGETPVKRSAQIALKCGCVRAKRFDANLYELVRLKREPYTCPRCFDKTKPARLQEVVTEKGGTLLTHYNGATKKVSIQCAKGHTFKATPAMIVRPKGSWCPHCHAEKSRGLLAELLASHGCVLTGEAPGDKTYVDSTGEQRTQFHSVILGSPPLYPRQRGNRRVRAFYDDDTMQVFYLAGEVPPQLPKRIADVVAVDDCVDLGADMTAADAYKRIEDAIASDNEIGDYKVLNVYRNPNWISPGVFTWGEIEAYEGTLVDTGDYDV